ncbi:MAG: hypothetical protein EU536_03805 [Promethearchaeota archaeon]|nr:MAG: hypothetical protein EU536_03805 [Candidatus Lokiarchaeota archaeon]
MAKKSLILILALFLPIFGCFMIQGSHAAVTNVWGVTDGESKTYSIRDEVRGSLSGILVEYFIQYKIIAVADTDSNNYSDVNILMIDLSTETIGITQLLLQDDAPPFPFGWAGTLTFYLADYAVDLYILINNNFHYLLCPSTFGPPNHGINWTAELITINTSTFFPNYNDYTGYDLGNRALITYELTNVWDGNLQTYYNLSGTILWDKTTGWLIALEYIRTYDSNFGFTIHTIIEPGTPSRLSDLSIKDIFGGLGFAIGIAGLCVTLFVFKKIR